MKAHVRRAGQPLRISVVTDAGLMEDWQKAGVSVQLEEEDGDGRLSVRISSAAEAVKWVVLRWEEDLRMAESFFGDALERGYGNLGWRGMDGQRVMPWYFLAAFGNCTRAYGVETGASAFCFWQADSAGVTLWLDVRNGGAGVELGGRTLTAAVVIWKEYRDCSPFEAAVAFCKAMCPAPLKVEGPLVGSNNWYYAYGDITESSVLADTDYIVKLMDGSGVKPYMVIDDGWQIDHEIDGYNGGPWKESNDRFPDMGALAEKIRAKGARPGIWIRPLSDERTELPEEWRLPHTGYLDPSHPDALDYITGNIAQLCVWGYELVKYDFVTYDLFGRWGFQMRPSVTADGWHFHDRSLTSAEVVKKLYEAIRKVTEPYGTVLIGCNAIGHLCAGLVHANRTGDDTSGRYWEVTRVTGVNTLAFRLCQHGTFYCADADCVGITDRIDWQKNRQWTDLRARSGTALFVSVRPGSLPEAEEAELSAMLKEACTGTHHAVPEDWMYRNCPECWTDGDQELHYDWYDDAGLGLLMDGIRVEQLPGSAF